MCFYTINYLEQNKKIKTLFISAWYPNRVKPTLGNFVQKHAEAVSLYAEVTVLHVCFDICKNKFDITEEKSGNINTIIIYINRPRIIFQKICRYFKAYKLGLDLINKKFGRHDIVHANVLFPVGLVFLFLKSFKKIPFVFSEHWTGYFNEDQHQIGFFKRYFLKKIAGKASCIMPVSEHLKNAMTDLGISGNYKIVPNVVNNAFFQPSLTKGVNTKFRFLHVSSLNDKQKNITGIIKTVHQLSLLRKDFEFTIVGEEDPAPFIPLVKELNIYNNFIFFESRKTSIELAGIMKESDCFVLFSNYESFSIVIAESLASGLPVIATDAGGLASDLTSQYGIIIPPRDERALLGALNKMIDHHDEYKKELLIKFAENFKAEIIGKEIIDIYNHCLNEYDK